MSLETGTRIQDLVPTNPVGATDFASQGDDHIRLIKACLQGSFPSLGANQVTASADELSIMDGVTLTAAQINDAARKGASNSFTQPNTFGNVVTIGDSVVPDGNGARSLGITGTRFGAVWTVNLNGFAVTDVARLSQSQTFTAQQNITATGGNTATLVLAGNGLGASSGLQIQSGSDGNGYMTVVNNAGLFFATNNVGRGSIGSSGNWTMNTPSSGYTLTVNGINSGAPIRLVSPNANVYLSLQNSSDTGGLIGYEGTEISLWTGGTKRASAALGFFVGAPTGGDKGAGTINSAAEIYQNGVRIQSLPCITSTSTTLEKGKLHHISGNATLPALGDGEWVCLVNNSGSDITITEHSGDTTYWSTGQVSISTVTLQARGRMFASGAGSSVVYVTGDITGYT